MASDDKELHGELDPNHEDPVIRVSNTIVRQMARALSVLMVLVIGWTILDAFYTFGKHLIDEPVLLGSRLIDL